jgi:peroxiredoxin Q/BCP
MKRVIAMVVMLAIQGSAVWAIQPGEPAPDFKAAATGGRTVSLGDFSGSWLVLYFYPKSFTPGCTAESCSLRDGYAGLQTLGATLLGVSLDKKETQEKFKAEHKLPFDLIADTDGAVAKAYGALGLGGFMAKRMTFLINPAGQVVRIIDSVKTGEHDKQVAEALRELQTPSP